jgi:hypothetical protein
VDELDLNKLSDEELDYIASLGNQSEAVVDVEDGVDLSQLSDDEINYIASLAPMPESEEKGFFEELPRYAAQGARHLAAGVADIPDIVHLPGNIYEIGKNQFNKAFAKKGEKLALPKFSSFGLGDKVASEIDELTGGYTAPQTEGEQLFESIGRGVGSGIGTGGIGTAARMAGAATKSGSISKIGKALSYGNTASAGNIASHAGASAAVHEQQKYDPDNMLGTLAAGYVGGGAGFQGAKYAKKLPQLGLQGAEFVSKPELTLRLKNKIYKVDPELVDAHLETGAPLNLGDVSNRKSLKIASNIAETHPSSEKTIKTNRAAQDEAALKALNIPGKEMTATDLGGHAKEAIKLAKNKAKEVANKIEDDYAKAFGAERPMKFENTKSFIEDTIDQNTKIKNVHDVSDAGKFMSSPFTVKAYEILNRIKDEGHLTFEKAREIRTEIGKWGQYNKFENSQQEVLFQKLYSKINEDLTHNFKTLEKGKHAKAWGARNEQWVKYHNEIKPRLKELSKAAEKGDFNVFNNLNTELKGGGLKFGVITDAMEPDKASAWTKNLIKSMGTDADGVFHSSMAYNNFKKLQPEVRDSLLNALGDDRKQVQNLLKAGKARASTEALRNTSSTDTQRQTRTLVKELPNAIVEAADGKFKALYNTLAGYAAHYAVGKKLTDQDLIKTLAYAEKINKKSQVPILLKKLEKIGVSQDTVKKLQATYHKALNKPVVSKGTGKKKGILSATKTVEAMERAPEKKEERKSLHLKADPKNYRLSPDKKFHIPAHMTDEQYYAEMAQ